MWWWMTVALAGDVWLTVEGAEDGNEVHLELPVNRLAEADEGVPARTKAGKAVDLRDEVRALMAGRAGVTRHYVVEEDDGDTWPVVLTARAPVKEPVDTLAVSITGKQGFALTFDMPLTENVDPGQLGQAIDVELGPPGVALDVEGVNAEQLRRGGERTLMRIVGPAGKGVEVRTVVRDQPG